MRTHVMRTVFVLVFALPLPYAMAQTGGAARPNAKQGNAVVEAARKSPTDEHLADAAGEYYFREERWKESAEWLSRAYRLSGQDAEIGYRLAYARIQAGELDAAETQLQQMAGSDASARVHSLLAEIEEDRGHGPNAVQEYYKAAQIEPSEGNIFDLANSLLQHKKYVGYLPEAVKYFRYGVSKFPQSSRLMVGLGVALYASEQYDDAVSVLCAAVDLNPSDQRPVTFLGMARKVSPELAVQVDKRLQTFAERYPANPAASYEYAMSLWDRGGGQQGENLPQIEALLERAVKAAPAWYAPHYQLGILDERQTKYREAIAEMRKATELEPDFEPAHFHLAMLYRRVGDGSRAAQQSAQAKRLNDAQIKSDMQPTPN